MSQNERTVKASRDTEAGPDLAELCRLHEVSLELIERSHDVDELLDRVLDEYETRLTGLGADALHATGGAPRGGSDLRGLMMFAAQAAALKEKAVAASELKRRAAMLEASNTQLASALEESRCANARLDAVLSTLSSGVMIWDRNGACVIANEAARTLLDDDASFSRLVAGGVPRKGEAEIDLPAGASERRTFLIARRAMRGGSDDEVVVVTDVTERNRAVEERVRLEKLGEVLKTLSVLSHKINNPLTAVMGRAQILQAKKGIDPHVIKAAEVIQEASQRIAELVRELTLVVKSGHQEAVDHLLDMSTGGRTGR